MPAKLGDAVDLDSLLTNITLYCRISRGRARRMPNIQRSREMPRGGQFAALEASDLLAADVTTFFRGLRAALAAAGLHAA